MFLSSFDKLSIYFCFSDSYLSMSELNNWYLLSIFNKFCSFCLIMSCKSDFSALITRTSFYNSRTLFSFIELTLVWLKYSSYFLSRASFNVLILVSFILNSLSNYPITLWVLDYILLMRLSFSLASSFYFFLSWAFSSEISVSFKMSCLSVS